MAARLGDLFETIIGVLTSVGAKSVEQGGKAAVLSAARKIGWANKAEGSSSRFATHRLGGHSLGSGASRSRDMSSYDPKKDYQARNTELYERSVLSGSGKNGSRAGRNSNSSGQLHLNRGNPLPSNFKPQESVPKNSPTSLKSKIKF